MPSPMTSPSGVTRDELLGHVDREVGHAVDAGVGDQLERVRAAHEQVVHVVRLVEEHGGLPPGLLLAPPVGELRGDHRVDVGAELGVAQQARPVSPVWSRSSCRFFAVMCIRSRRVSLLRPVARADEPAAAVAARDRDGSRLRAQSRVDARPGDVAPHTAGCRAAPGHIGRARLRQMSRRRGGPVIDDPPSPKDRAPAGGRESCRAPERGPRRVAPVTLAVPACGVRVRSGPVRPRVRGRAGADPERRSRHLRHAGDKIGDRIVGNPGHIG